MGRETRAVIAVCFCFLNDALVGGDGVTWQLEPSIADGHVLTARIETLYVPSLSHCMAACYDVPSCVTVGYSPAGPSCQMYSADLAEYSSLIYQPNTTFFKSVCKTIEYTYVRALGTCMRRYPTPLGFTAARTVCQADGGDLLVVNSDEKRIYLREVLRNIPDSLQYWVAATQVGGDINHWTWVSGDNVTATNGGTYWAQGEPSSVVEGCMELVAVGSDVGFQDSNCDIDRMFICEMTAS